MKYCRTAVLLTMRKIAWCTAVLGMLLSLPGTTQAATWMSRINSITTGWHMGSVITNSDGTFFLFGRDVSQQTINGVQLAKLGGDGVVQWLKRPTDVPGYFPPIGVYAKTPDGGVILFLMYDPAGAESRMDIIAKVNTNGSLLWQYGLTPSFGYPQQIIVDGDYLYLASSNSSSEVRVAKLDLLTMTPIWSKVVSANVALASMRRDLDGGLLLVGDENSGTLGSVILKISASGDIVFSKKATTPLKYVGIYDIVPLSDGYAFTGYTQEGAGAEDFWIGKISTAFAFRWQKAIGGCGREFASRIMQMSNGSLLIGGGLTSGSNNGTHDAWAINVRSTNNWGINWQKKYWTLDSDAFDSIAEASDGGIMLFGETGAAGDYAFSAGLLIKADATGAIAAAPACSGTVPCPAVTNTSLTVTNTTVTISDYPVTSSDLVLSLLSSGIALEDGAVGIAKFCGD